MEQKSTSGKLGLEVPIHPDHRFRVQPTNVSPYYWVGELKIKFRNNPAIYTGTGTLLNSNHVLTCAHNLWDIDNKNFAERIAFYLARDGQQQPYQEVQSSTFFIPEDYQTRPPPQPDWQTGNAPFDDCTEYLWDFGLVRLEKELDPAQGLFPAMLAATDDELRDPGHHYSIAGYPADKHPQNTMWDCVGPLQPDAADDQIFFHKISTYGGNSGSAVRGLFPNRNPHFPHVPWIVGVHVAGSAAEEINWAVRLNSRNIETINRWMLM